MKDREMRKKHVGAFGILAGLAIVLLLSAVVFVRFLSPTHWLRIVGSPHQLHATLVAYRQLQRMTSAPEERRLWNYEVVLERAPAGLIHVVYVPRMHVDAARQDKQHPGAGIQINSGRETHVYLDDSTLNVKRAYFSD